jgi:ABC-type antimicrobial peptide transport system permease subunit
MWTDPVMKFVGVSPAPRRIVGVVGDVDDENVVPGPALTVFQPVTQAFGAGRLFVHTSGDPYALVSPITRIIRGMSADQPVERAATLEDVRAEVLTPDRLNAMVFGVFAGVALVIAVVGVAGVLAFSVSSRTREFGIRLALGSQPRHLLTGVIAEGAAMAVGGIATGAIAGFVLAQAAGSYFQGVRTPGVVPAAGAALLLVAAAVTAAAVPAARAARVDAITALRAD